MTVPEYGKAQWQRTARPLWARRTPPVEALSREPSEPGGWGVRITDQAGCSGAVYWTSRRRRHGDLAMWNDLEILSGKSPLVLRDATISVDRVVGCDILRRDHLGRRIVVVPKGQGVPDDIELTDRERALVRPAPRKRPPVMRSSGFGFWFE
jgi:hypothetical protein